MTEQRKHVKQMTPTEVEAITSLVRGLASTLSLTGHASERLSAKGISLSEVQSAVRNGKLVEFKQAASGHYRALVRHDGQFKACCVVVEFGSKQVITAWTNSVNDKHFTLDWNQYQWKSDLTALIHSIQRSY